MFIWHPLSARPKYSGFIVGIQVCEINHTVQYIERGRVIDTLIIFPFHICKKVFAAGLEEIIKNEGVHLMHVVGRAVLADNADLDFILLHCCQVRTDVFLTFFESKIFEFSLFRWVINHEMWLDYDQHDLEKDDIACYTPIINFISIHELLIVGLKIGVAGSFHVIFEDEADGVAELANLDIVLIDEAKVPRYICVDGLDINVRGYGEV